MRIQNPFHEGELLVQQRAGETAKAEQNGKIIADSIIEGAFKFIEQQSMVILGSVDHRQNVWASILLGYPGFIRVVDPQTVEFDLKQAFIDKSDCLWRNIDRENRIGMLVIELATRRRLRINGALRSAASEGGSRVKRHARGAHRQRSCRQPPGCGRIALPVRLIDLIAPDKLRLQVAESYPNCPKYIQRRHLSLDIDANPKQSPFIRGAGGDLTLRSQSGQILTAKQEELIRSADTFFVASFHTSRGVDISHRGGNPGFIRVSNRTLLRIPDYIGNGMFNTLGNLATNPDAGLVFIDFDRSRTLQLVGKANILWDLEDEHRSETKRYWDFKIEQWFETDLPIKLNCEFLDYSPYNPQTV